MHAKSSKRRLVFRESFVESAALSANELPLGAILAEGSNNQTQSVVGRNNLYSVAKRLDLPARLSDVPEKPSSEVSDDDAFGIASEKPDEIGYAIVAYGKAGLCIFADQPFRPDEAAVCDDEIQVFEQSMKAWPDLDKVRTVEETLSFLFHEVPHRLYALAVYGRNRCDSVGPQPRWIRDPDYGQLW